jgi:thiol-disulfide isomerase/thioredoxin
VVGVVVLLAVLGGTAVAGLLWRGRSGRIRSVGPVTPAPDGPAPDAVAPEVLAGLKVDPAAAPVTLVQFSTAFCQPCRATRRVLGEVTRLLPAVAHVEVSAEDNLGAVRALGIMRTPTVLVLDPAGRVVKRASGQPRVADVVAAVAPLLPPTRA